MVLLLLPVGEGSGKVWWIAEGTSFSFEYSGIFDVIFISWGVYKNCEGSRCAIAKQR
jgi:hypothetical protein